MEDREFSSPVCYLDYDNHQITTPERETSAFCANCTSFIAALHEKVKENEVKLEELSNEQRLEFVLTQEEWVYETKENIVESAEKGCCLCSVIFEGLQEDERKMLKASKEYVKGWQDGKVLRFERDLSGSGVGFRLAPLYTGNIAVEVKGKF